MADHPESHNDQLAALLRGRRHLLEQIEVSQRTSKQSRELIKQIDELLAKSPVKPEP